MNKYVYVIMSISTDSPVQGIYSSLKKAKMALNKEDKKTIKELQIYIEKMELR